MSGSATITGKVDFTSSTATISGGGSIGGTTTASLWPVTKGVPAPEFPSVNPQPFIDYMVGARDADHRQHEPPELLQHPHQGRLQRQPLRRADHQGSDPHRGANKVTFSGGANIQGLIVVANTTDATSTNEIIFSGGGTMTGPELLDPAVYGPLVDMGGGSILAPNFKLTMTGGSASFGGTIIAKSVGLTAARAAPATAASSP